jgi:hypothetical protein
VMGGEVDLDEALNGPLMHIGELHGLPWLIRFIRMQPLLHQPCVAMQRRADRPDMGSAQHVKCMYAHSIPGH